MSKRRLGILVASTVVLVAGAGGLAACGSAGSGGGTSAAAVATAKVPEAAPPADMSSQTDGAASKAGGVAAGAAGTAPGAATLTPADVTRSVIHSGTITVRVKDVDTAADSAAALATGSGGYVGGDDRTLDGGRSTATVTLRVPAERFDATLSALAALGKEASREVSTQDVTEQVVDVQSRLATQQASVDRIRELIASTTTINEIIALEDELTQREADLESMEAQVRSLTDLTALSTITAVLIGPDATATPTPKKDGGFIGGLKAGWSGFLSGLRAVMLGLGTALPFLIVVAVILAIGLVVRHRRRRTARRATATAGAAGAAPPSPAP